MQLSLVKQYPLLRVVIPLVLGIWISDRVCCHAIFTPLLFSSFVIWLVLAFYLFRHPSYHFRYLTGLLFIVFIFSFGVEWFHVRTTDVVNGSSPVTVKGYISSVEGETPKSYKYKIVSEELITDSVFTKQKLTGLLYLRKDTTFRPLEPGETIFVSGRLIPFSEPANPYAFDYSKYLKRERISFRVWTSIDNLKRIDELPVVTVAVFTGRLRDRISKFYEKNGLKGEELSVLKAMFLGDRSELLPEDKRSFSHAGVIHLLAVSGLHLGIIYLMLILLLKPLSSDKLKKYRVIVVLIVLWSYALLTGLSPSVFRSAIMFSLVEIGTLMRRHSSVYHQLLASILIIVLIEPYSILKAGFWLSHVAVASIVYFYPLINSFVNFRFIFFRWVWSLISVSVAAQIGTFALSIYYFNMFPTYFIIGNILLVPLMAPVLILAFISAALSFLPFTNIAEIFVYPLNDLIGFMIDVTHFTEQLPNAVITNISITDFELVLFGLIFISILLFNLEIRKSAIFILLTSFILLIVSFSYAKIRKLRFESFVVYSQRGIGIFNHIGSNINTLYLTDSMSTIQQGYVCGGYWAKHNAKSPEVKIVDNVKPQVISFTVDDKRILLLYRVDKLPELIFNPEVDFVVLSSSPRISIEQIVNLINPEKIIVSADNKPWVITRLKREAIRENVFFYDVIKQGAWICETGY